MEPSAGARKGAEGRRRAERGGSEGAEGAKWLTVSGAVKTFDATRALDGVDLTVADGAFVCLLGPSGCGKTTLLRTIAGLEAPDAGTVRLAGRDVTDVPAHERGIGYVFQEGALFPHLDVARNVAFGLRGRSTSDVRARVNELLKLVGLEGYGARKPDQLSGGEKQRVALARALAPEPRVLLMDEPLASLDRALREELRREIRRLHDETGITTVFVTHDTEEALALADVVHVMRAGRIVESGAPRDIYLCPRTPFAARFLGAANVLPARVHADGTVTTALGAGKPGELDATPGADARALVRPADVHVTAREKSTVTARVDEVRFLGRHQRVDATLEDAGARVFLETRLDEALAAGDVVGLHVEWARVRVVPSTDAR